MFFCEVVKTFLTPLLVIIGWVVVYKTQANRERRKVLREQLSEITKTLYELEHKSIDYHCKARDRQVESDLLFRISHLELACNFLPKNIEGQCRPYAADKRRLQLNAHYISDINEAITLHHFMDEHEGPVDLQGQGSEIIEGIRTTFFQAHEAVQSIKLALLD